MSGKLWYYHSGDAELGPVSAEELQFLRRSGAIHSQTLVRAENSTRSLPFASTPLAAADSRSFRKPTSSATASALFRSCSPKTAQGFAEEAAPAGAGIAIPAVPPPLPASSAALKRRRLTAAAGVAALLLAAVSLFLWRSLPTGMAQSGTGPGAAHAGNHQTSEQQTTAAAESLSDSAADTDADAQGAASAASAASAPAESAAAAEAADTRVADLAEMNESATGSAEVDDSGVGIDDTDKTALAGGLAVGGGHEKFSVSAPGETTFFGLRGSGRRFSWVVDCSGSMSGLPLQRAKEELMNSLQRLPEGLEFQIIFFDDQHYAFPASGFADVSEESLKSAEQFISGISGGGGTNVQRGMRQALGGTTRPDTIFLLTDGEFDPRTPDVIRSQNRTGQTRINTVAFVDRAGEPLLRMIAAENRGDFRFVP
jgi:hypothetical protein